MFVSITHMRKILKWFIISGVCLDPTYKSITKHLVYITSKFNDRAGNTESNGYNEWALLNYTYLFIYSATTYSYIIPGFT